MKVDINIKTISIAIGIAVTIGTIFLGLFELLISKKLEPIYQRLTAIETKMDMLLEERLVKMEKNDLYRRFVNQLNRENKMLKTTPSQTSE